MTADEVLYKLAARCSVSEQCMSDIEAKLAKFDLPEEEKIRILRHPNLSAGELRHKRRCRSLRHPVPVKDLHRQK